VALEGRLIDGDAPPRRFLHSIACGFHREENGIYLRTPNHLNPIKRSLALAVRFADVWFGEDRDFARRIAPTLRTEARQLLGQPLYFYMNGARAKALAASTRLLFKFPTRGRPDLFRATMEKAVARLSRRQKVRFLVSIDDDDTTMKTPEVRRFLRRLRASVDVKVVSGTSSSKVEAVNRDLTGEDFDVLVVMSDDMEPVVDGYDEEIANDMARYFPGLDGAILYDDGFQKPGDRPMPIMTLPVLGRRLYDTLGYVYHPSYVSEWCDDEMTEVVRRRGALHHAGKLIIEHRWVGTHHADSLHRRNSAFHDRDRANYQQRRAAGFPA
jgi:hypothetical protein